MPYLLGLKGPWAGCQAGGKIAGLNPAEPSEPGALSTGEVRGMRGVAVKCIDIRSNTSGEGGLLDNN